MCFYVVLYDKQSYTCRMCMGGCYASKRFFVDTKQHLEFTLFFSLPVYDFSPGVIDVFIVCQSIDV